jgi:hypothetical protein
MKSETRLVESLDGRGRLFDGPAPLGEVTYSLRIYQSFIDGQPSLGSGQATLSGRNFFDLMGRTVTLEISDGRRISVLTSRLGADSVSGSTSGSWHV